MKKLISLLIVFCMVLSCAAVAASADEKNDYSKLFFDLMSNYIEENELIKSSYKLLGTISNGIHVAYCEYNIGHDVDADLSYDKYFKLGNYLLSSNVWDYDRSSFRIYCFDSSNCCGIMEAFHTQVDPSDSIPYWLKSVPLNEIAEIVNKSEITHIYHKNDLSENDELNAYFKDEMILPYFKEYAGYSENDYSYCRVYGKYDKYYIFFGLGNGGSDMFISRVIDNYVVTASNIYEPYDLGIYAFDGEKVYTLEEAINAKYFKMSDIADMIEAKPLIMGEVTGDGKVDMNDVVFLQKIIARLFPFQTANQSQYNNFSADIDNNRHIDMYDVVLIQRIIAKL